MQMLCSDQCTEILLHGISDLNGNRCTGAAGSSSSRYNYRSTCLWKVVGWLHSSGSTFSISIIYRQVVDRILPWIYAVGSKQKLCAPHLSQRNDDDDDNDDDDGSREWHLD